MLKATLQWFAAAPAADIAAARSVLAGCLQLGGHPSAAVRMELVQASGTLAREAVVWAGFGGAACNPLPEDRDAYLQAEECVLQVRPHPSCPESTRAVHCCCEPVMRVPAHLREAHPVDAF